MPSSRMLRIFRGGQAGATFEYAVPPNVAVVAYEVTSKDQEGDKFTSGLELHLMSESDPEPSKLVDPADEDESPTRKKLTVLGDDPRPSKSKK